MKRMKFILVCMLVCSILVSCVKKESIIHPPPPEVIIFDTFEGIQEFVSSVKSDTESNRYDASGDEYDVPSYLSYEEANKIAQDIAGTMIPKIKDGLTYGSFSGTYYVDYDDPLRLTYRKSGILYRFVYSYNVTEATKIKGKVVLRDVSIGSTTFDLYARQEEMYGTFMLGTTEVYVSVATDDPEAVNFDCFEFVTITRNP